VEGAPPSAGLDELWIEARAPQPTTATPIKAASKDFELKRYLSSAL
jgi:hypothetical protein